MRTFFIIVILALLFSTAGAEEMNAAASEQLFSQVCSTCHGPTGRGMASFPRLSDKTKEYLVDRLNKYRAGEKIGPNTPLMAPHAVNLTDAQIDGLAAYISAVLPTREQ